MSDTKYYHIENCNRHVLGDGQKFTFEPYEQVGGCWFGVLATDNPDEIKALDKVVTNKKSAVTVITAEDYAKAQKKRKLAQPDFGPSRGASARAFSGDAQDVASLSGQVPNVDPDVNVPDVPPPSATPQAAAENVGQLAAPEPKVTGKKK